MATALGNAKEIVDKVWTGVNELGGDMPTGEAIALVQAYAAIAQAEQLKRIADALYSRTHDFQTGEVNGESSIADSAFSIAMAQ